MIEVRRLMAVGAVLTLAAIFTCSHVWGEPGPDKDQAGLRASTGQQTAPESIDRRFAEELATSRFAERALVTYDSPSGERLFGLQVKLPLADVPARPRDYLVLVDVSASMARGPLSAAQRIADVLVAQIAKGNPEDRVALWTISTEAKCLSKTFKPAKDLNNALAELKNEYPAGAVDLKSGLPRAIDSFEAVSGRQRVMIFLGAGTSIAGPVDADDRAALSETMVKKEITFFPVPLGSRFDSLNLHGFANGTGGKVVRIPASDRTEELLARLEEAIAAPVLYPTALKLPQEVSEAYPTRLPPLRRDAPTLVVGKMKPTKEMKELAYSVMGKVQGKDVTVPVKLALPESEVEHYFLAGMVKQWSEKKDRPALTQADRALAFAFEQNQFARADLLTKAEWTLEQNQFDAAIRLFEQTRQLDPSCKEAEQGIQIAKDLRDGKTTREALGERFAPKGEDLVVHIDQNTKPVKLTRKQLLPAEEKQDEKQPPLAPADVEAKKQIEEVKARQAIAEQQASREIDEAIRQARRLVQTDPDAAKDLLKRTLDNIVSSDLTQRARISLGDRLRRALESVEREGAVVKRDQRERLELAAVAQARLGVREREIAAQDRIRERMRVFHTYMDQGREEEAFRQAMAIRADLISQGQEVPPAVTAGAYIGLAGEHLREERRLRYLRQERVLAVLLEVERSHVPYPDEPTVNFPTEAMLKRMTRGYFDNWKDFSNYRIKRYAEAEFGENMPPAGLELRDKLGKPVDYPGLEDARVTLAEVLDQLAKRYGLSFDVNESAFKVDGVNDPLKQEITGKNPIPPMKTTLGTVLKKILARVEGTSGATYIIRRDQIEITTNKFAAAEKATRVYPVADLVTPIPNSFNQQAVTQQASLFGVLGALGIGGLGALGGGLGALGVGGLGALGIGGLGALGGGLGALGGGLGALGVGGLGALGGGLGALGVGGLGALGGGLGALGGGLGALGGGLGALGGGLGALGAGGLGALGGVQLGGGLQFGGGIGALGGGGVQLGFGGGVGGLQFGGQLGGQFGNLGGQFGLQGGNFSQVLINTIKQVVGKPKDWAINYNPFTGQPLDPLAQEGDIVDQENNQLGYYPPALALVAKATSRIQTHAFGPVAANIGQLAAQAPGRERGGQMVRIDGKGNNSGNIKVAGDGDKKKEDLAQVPVDPKKVWKDALEKGGNNPGLIIACADYLALNGKFDHAAEFLKANLRLGIVVKPWVYQALAVALRESGGSPEEIERVETSVADLQPLDAQGYLKVSQELAKDKRFNRAVAFCRQASVLEPNTPYPYAEALLYAELAQDAKAMEWAAGNLLKQDWPVNNKELQTKATQKLESLAKSLEKTNRSEERRRLLESVSSKRQRDLVIKLSWQGTADLDLKVKEPTGSICWTLNRQTIGGGTLVGDSLADMTSETYLAAEAFNGTYEVTVESVWGKPLFGRAQLTIIRHQGTKDETQEVQPIDLKAAKPVVVQFTGGRRKETAYVPPPSAQQPPEPPAAKADAQAEIWQKLRALADPEVSSFQRGFSGETGSPIAGIAASKPSRHDLEPRPNDKVLYQTKVTSFVKNALDVTAQVTLSADRRTARLSLTPVVNTATTAQAAPVVTNPLIPGN